MHIIAVHKREDLIAGLLAFEAIEFRQQFFRNDQERAR